MIRKLALIGALLVLPAFTLTPAASQAAVPSSVAAHQPEQSYLYLRVHSDSMVVRFEITWADLERALGFGWDPEADMDMDLVMAQLDSIRGYVESHAQLTTANGPYQLRFRNVDRLDVDLGDFLLLNYVVDNYSGIPDEIDVRYTVVFEVDRDHRNLILVEHNWRTTTFENESVHSLILSPRNPEQTLDLSSSSVLRGLIGFIWLGVWHIWIGIDHILFLMALVLPAVLYRDQGRWEPAPTFKQALWKIITIVTFFTIAHSVTLSMAALDVIRLPSHIVEAIIAGSIAVAAWANLVPRLEVKEWAIAFAFGLFHGFGFATVLGDIGMGREFLVLSLLGFNVGVELGQVAVIAAVFPLLFALRRTWVYPKLLRYGSVLLIALALLWMFERLFGFNIPLVATARAVLGWVIGLVPGI